VSGTRLCVSRVRTITVLDRSRAFKLERASSWQHRRTNEEGAGRGEGRDQELPSPTNSYTAARQASGRIRRATRGKSEMNVAESF